MNKLLIVALVIVPSFFGAFKMPREMGVSAAAICLAIYFTNREKFARPKLATPLHEPMLGEMALAGRADALDVPSKSERAGQIVQRLRQLGVEDAEIEEIVQPFYETITRDHIKMIYSCLSIVNGDEKGLIRKQAAETTEWNLEEFNRFVKEGSYIESAHTRASVEDLEFFLKNRKIRSPEAWAAY
jgi:hypothetical protein